LKRALDGRKWLTVAFQTSARARCALAYTDHAHRWQPLSNELAWSFASNSPSRRHRILRWCTVLVFQIEFARSRCSMSWRRKSWRRSYGAMAS
jgi:hypothetical protein